MKSTHAKMSLLAITLAVAGLLAVAFLTVKEDEYRESDRLAWYLMTPAVIAKVPKISKDYSFSYTPDDNYGYEVNSIHFHSVENIEQKRLLLEEYVNNKRPQLDSREDELNVNSDSDRKELSVELIHYTRSRK